MSAPYPKDSLVYTGDSYGDGTVYRGERSKDSTEKTIDLTSHEYKMLWYAACSEIEKLTAERYEARMVAATGAKYIEENEQLKSALREAKESLDFYLAANDPSEFGCACDLSVGHLCGPCHTDKQQYPLRKSIATINAVLKDE